MEKHKESFKRRLYKVFLRLKKLPKTVRIALAVFLILFGAVNIINPFLNGIFLMILWIGLISEPFIEKLLKQHYKHK